jgi:hypothetical protein
VPTTSASLPRLLFLLRPLTVLMSQARQAVCAINQSILLRCQWKLHIEIVSPRYFGFLFKLTFTFILTACLPQMALNKLDHFALMNFGFGFYEKERACLGWQGLKIKSLQRAKKCCQFISSTCHFVNIHKNCSV